MKTQISENQSHAHAIGSREPGDTYTVRLELTAWVYINAFRAGASMTGQKKKQQQRRKTLKQGWWKHETDMLKIEAMQRDVRKRMWGTYAWMATEAKPHLYNNAYKVSGTAMHLLNNAKLTKIAEARKTDRQFAVNDSEWPVEANYVFSSGYVDNIKDDKGVYHADVDGEHPTTTFVHNFKDTKPIPLTNVSLKTTEDIWDPRYISAIHTLFTKEKLEAAFNFVGINATHLNIAQIDVKEAGALLVDFCSTNSKFKFHKPVVVRTFTTDYTLYTISLLAECDDLSKHFIKVHKRMVLVESNIGQLFKLPLTEELFVELYRKPQLGTVGNLLLEARSVVLTAAATKVTNAGDVKPVKDELHAEKVNTCSHLHFFGNNAFSVKIPNHSPLKRGGFKSVHNAAAFMAGWTIRELISATSEFGITHTEPDETFHRHLLINSGDVYKDAVKRVKAHSTHLSSIHRDVARNSFIGRQDAKTLLSGKDGKMFYVKVWMATPTMAVICLSPQEDASKNNVFVWTFARGFETSTDLTPAPVDPPTKPGASSVGGHGGTATAYQPPIDRRGPFSRRFFESARHRSTLPPELELELQSL